MAAVRRAVSELGSLTRYLQASLTLQPARGFAAGRGDGVAAHQGSPTASQGAVDTKHRSATELMWPASKFQERFAARVHTALNSVLVNNAKLREKLVRQLGFAVQDIRMSPDNLKAYIQWDSCLGHHIILEKELQKQLPKLKTAVAHALRARNMPQLVFRHDALTQKQWEVEDMLRRLDEEEEEDEEQEEGEGQDAGKLTADGGEAELGPAAAVTGSCRGTTKAGVPCKKAARDGGYCHLHGGVEQRQGVLGQNSAPMPSNKRGKKMAGNL